MEISAILESSANGNAPVRHQGCSVGIKTLMNLTVNMQDGEFDGIAAIRNLIKSVEKSMKTGTKKCLQEERKATQCLTEKLFGRKPTKEELDMIMEGR